MNVDLFLEDVVNADRKLLFPRVVIEPGRAPETLDALFDLPMLALTTMMVARRNPFRTVFLGRNVAMLLVEHFAALRRAPRVLDGSITLRRRCADALAFLEAAKLVEISSDQQRIVNLTREGKSHLARAIRNEADLGLFVRRLLISQERVVARSGHEH